MSLKVSRRKFLAGSAAAGAGLAFGAVPLRLARAEGKIVVGVEAGSPYETFYAKHAPEFTKATGVEVEFISIPHDNIRQQFVQDALAGAGGFDVYIADQVWLPEFYEKGFIVDLTSALSDADRGDFSKTAIETVSYDGAVVALPIMVHNCAMYYRTDLLKAAGLDAPPATWDEYRQMAKAMTKDGIWGTMILSKQGIEAATRLNAFYQQNGSDIIDAAGKPTIDTDAGHAALEFMTGAVFEDKSAPEGVLELPDMQGAWLDGKLALAPVWPYLYSLSKEPLGNNFAIGTAPGNQQSRRHGLFLGLCRCGRVEESRRRSRVGQVVDHDRSALQFRQGVAEPGAAGLGDRQDRRRSGHQRQRQGGDLRLRRFRRGGQEHADGAAIFATPRRARHHPVRRHVEGDEHRRRAEGRAGARRSGHGRLRPGLA